MNLKLLRIASLAAGVLLSGVAMRAASTPTAVQRNGIALAPVRFGVGWRQGIALSYMNFSRTKRYNPL